MDLVVKSEIRDGTRAVILAPVKPERSGKGLEDMNPGCPVILLGQSLMRADSGYHHRVWTAGRLEGCWAAAASQAPRDVPVYLCRDWTMGQRPGLRGVRTVRWMSGDIITGLLRGKTRTHTTRPYRKRTLRRRQDHHYSTGCAVAGPGHPDTGENTIPGPGGRALRRRKHHLLLRALDKGIVTGMTAYNQFDEDILSVKQAVEAIQVRQKQQTMLEAIYVDEDKLRIRHTRKCSIPLSK